MILCDHTIQKYLKNNKIKITPKPSPEQIQPNSIDLTLSNEYLKPIITDEILDTRNNTPKYEPLKTNAIILPPNSFVLGCTRELVEVPDDLMARVEGRSSIGRLGVQVHITAGLIDSGFKGKITLEIHNVSPVTVMLYEGLRVCQIVFEELDDVPAHLYGDCGNKYQGQDSVTGSLLFYDDDNVPSNLNL